MVNFSTSSSIAKADEGVGGVWEENNEGLGNVG